MAQNNENKKGKGKGFKLILFGGIVLVLLVLGVGIGMFLFSGAEGETVMSRFASSAEASESSIPLEEFLVNLESDMPKSQPVVQMQITVTSLHEDATEIITTDIAKVRDAVIHSVSNQSVETIYDEAEGHFIIKNEIKERINQALNEEIVEDVFITDILLQK